MANIWKELKKLKRPLMVLAPMADVTDAAFRHIIAKYGRPDATWTEFVSADGLVRASPEGKAKLLRDLLYSENERPIIAQFFSSHTEYMYEAGKIAVELGFDGADINMGCPVDAIEKQGAGSAMMKNPERAKEVIRALKKGIEDATNEKNAREENVKAGKVFEVIPVSVKTRVGFNKVELETWLPALLEEHPALITIHARTRKEMSKVPARWEHVARAVEIRNEMQAGIIEEDRTLIFGNGDVLDIADGNKKAAATGADGVMLGRAIFGNPWLFHRKDNNPHADFEYYEPTTKEKLEVMLEHTKLFLELLGDIKNFAIMKKHYKAYVNGFDGAKELRLKLMETETYEAIEVLVKTFLGGE